MRLGVKAALAGGELVDGDVDIEDGVIARVGVSPAGSEGVAVPGFVDVHINGIDGVDFLAADPDAYRRAGEALARTGVVAYQPTFVSSDESAYGEPLRAAAAAIAEDGGGALPLVLGVHLEGPFLSTEWPGAHDPEHLRIPDLGLAERLVGAGPVTTMTLAPELPGALELIDWLVARDVVVSCGHSDADAAQAYAAFDRGARAITHVYNAHRRWRPRDPGIAGAALVRAGRDRPGDRRRRAPRARDGLRRLPRGARALLPRDRRDRGGTARPGRVRAGRPPGAVARRRRAAARRHAGRQRADDGRGGPQPGGERRRLDSTRCTPRRPPRRGCSDATTSAVSSRARPHT